MKNDAKILKISNTKYTLKQSPHYEEQKDEIELLNNIIPDRLSIESDDPNYILNIKVKSSLENPEKEYRLKIYLNYFYPEKSPRFEFFEINDFLQEFRKKDAILRLNKVLEENLGLITIFQLYEAAVEFADEEEERRAKIIEEYKKQIKQGHSFPLAQMKIYKQFDNINVTDFVELKNNYLILACCENKFEPHLRIIDESYSKIIYELNLLANSKNKKYQFEIKKIILYSITNNEDELYLLCSDKIIRKFNINYLKKKSNKTGLNISIQYNTKNNYNDFYDMILLKDHKYFIFLCKNEIIFWQYNGEFNIFEENMINHFPNSHNCNEIFYVNQNLFVLTSSKNNKIIFLHFEDNYLKQNKWGKGIKINCSIGKNYLVKINEKNLLFGNNTLKQLNIIYIPTCEIVSKYEWNTISSIFNINNSIYICDTKGINEINFKRIYLSENARNNKPSFNNIGLIKPIQKGYYSFSSPSSFMICK